MRSAKSEWISHRKNQPLQMKMSPLQRQYLPFHLNTAQRIDLRQPNRLRGRQLFPLDQPHPAIKSKESVEWIPFLLARFRGARKFLVGWARIAEVLRHRHRSLCFIAGVDH